MIRFRHESCQIGGVAEARDIGRLGGRGVGQVFQSGVFANPFWSTWSSSESSICVELRPSVLGLGPALLVTGSTRAQAASYKVSPQEPRSSSGDLSHRGEHPGADQSWRPPRDGARLRELWAQSPSLVLRALLGIDGVRRVGRSRTGGLATT